MLTNDQIIDSLITDCNDAVRACVGGQYIGFCNIMVKMVQKLANLKSGIANDLKSREENIVMLEKRLSDLGHPIEKISAEELKKN